MAEAEAADEDGLDDDDKKLIELIHNTTNKHVLDFIGSFGERLVCPLCKNTDWTLLGDKKNPATLQLSAYYKGLGFTLSYGLVCDTCGSLHLISASQVASWKNESDDNE